MEQPIFIVRADTMEENPYSFLKQYEQRKLMWIYARTEKEKQSLLYYLILHYINYLPISSMFLCGGFIRLCLLTDVRQ